MLTSARTARKLYFVKSPWLFFVKSPQLYFKIETLHEKTGSRSTLAEFRRMLIKIINGNAEHEHIPDYTFTRDGDGGSWVFLLDVVENIVSIFEGERGPF